MKPPDNESSRLDYPTVAKVSREGWQKGSEPRFSILLCNTAAKGLGFDEEETRGIHQGWAVTVLPDNAVYMSATEPLLVII